MATINPLAGPINYVRQVQDPFESALGGFKLGAGIAEADAQRLQAQQKQQAMMQAQQNQVELSNVLSNPNATANDFERVLAFLPKDQAAIVTQGFERKTKADQDESLKSGAEIYSAFKSNNPEIGNSLLSQKALALRNSGREAEAKQYETYIELVKADRTSATNIIGLMISGLPNGKQLLENVDKTLSTGRQEQKAPFELVKLSSEAIIKQQEAKFAPENLLAKLNLTTAQINQAKAAAASSYATASATTAKGKRDNAEANSILQGFVPIEKRPTIEADLRKEYNTQTKPFQEVKSAYGRVLNSDNSAVGDLSLIFGFMKMLDPGSVVREGEFATAQNATGVPDRIQNIYNKVASGERLNENQRKSFKGQANGLYKSALEGESTVRSGIDRIAKGYGLNTENIFYTSTEQAPSQVKNPNVVIINGVEQLRPANFTDKLWEDYKKSQGVK